VKKQLTARGANLVRRKQKAKIVRRIMVVETAIAG